MSVGRSVSGSVDQMVSDGPVDEPYIFLGHYIRGQGHSDLQHKNDF